MPSSNGNTILFATRVGRYPAVNLPSGLTANTNTLIATGDAAGSLLLDVLFRNLDNTNSRLFEVILCPTGAQATAENARCMINIPAGIGNSGTTVMASLAALQPPLFSIDLAGNRCLALEAGQSLYLRNGATLTASIYVTPVIRDYTA